MKPLSPPTLAACVLLCACASPKEKSPSQPQAAVAKSANKSSNLSSYFPEGVTWENATPEQISEAVFAATKADPDRAAEIAVVAIKELRGTGRFPLMSSGDAKEYVDPEPKWTLFGWLFKKKNPKPKPTTTAMSAEMEFEQVGR